MPPAAPADILAKSARGEQRFTLLRHACDVGDCVTTLLGAPGAPTALASAWLRFFRLRPEDHGPLLVNAGLAAALHDIGKANAGFQAAVQGRGEQAVRHEHLSALTLRREPWRAWLEAARPCGVDPAIVLGAVASHHLKARHDDFARPQTESERPVCLWLTHADVRGSTLRAAQFAAACGGRELAPPPELPDWWPSRAELLTAADDFKRHAHGVGRELRRPEQQARRRLLLAVKAALIAADAAASAALRTGLDRDAWLQACFGGRAGRPLTPDWLEANVIAPRLREIERRTPNRRFVWHDFQEAAGRLGARALLVSGCGTGKTLAAWRWVRGRLAAHPASRAIFLYPTRATATEGFRDYVSWAGDDEAALQHGTSAFDIEGLFDNPDDPRHGGDYGVAPALFAIGYWPRRVFSATVDAFLAFMKNQYGALCMLPVLADAVLVVDEVHAFDRSMLGALEGFLKTFDLPVLCMTATLTADRRRVLQRTAGEPPLETFPASLAAFADLEAQSARPRYRVAAAADAEAALAEVVAALRAGQKVLWVVNTVERCQAAVRRLHAALAGDGAPADAVRCYHSRFRLGDRKARHEDVIRAFRRRERVVAVTTQVCEMSLDLDADVLVSELAPLPALVQRMGRCCRQPNPPPERTGAVVVYPAVGARPYDEAALRQAAGFVAALVALGRPVSQAELAEAVEQAEATDPAAADAYNGFVDGGLYAAGHDESFRDTDDFTVDAVLDADVAEFVGRRARRDPTAAALVLPVPRRLAHDEPRLGRRLRAAPTSHYDPQVGFSREEVAMARKAASSPVQRLTLDYDPLLLPTAQHRAGLAGLLALTESMARRGRGPLPEIAGPDADGRFAVSWTPESLQAVFDELYDAGLEEQARQQKKTAGKGDDKRELAPKREEERLDEKSGKSKTVYIYDQNVPRAAFLGEMGLPDAWCKLWRDALWSTLRGIPKTRTPYDERAAGKPVSLAPKVWEELVKFTDGARRGDVRTGPLASSVYIGAMDSNAERVPFEGRVDHNLLLHFWCVVMGVFEARAVGRDGKDPPHGFVLVIPDVADVRGFVADFRAALAERANDSAGMAGRRPRSGLIYLPEEGALEFLSQVMAVARARALGTALAYNLAGVDVFHLCKVGNNIAQLSASRLPLQPDIVAQYEALIRGRYTNPLFRRQLIVNVLRGAPWFRGFQRVFATKPADQFVGGTGRWFRMDAAKRFGVDQQERRQE